MKYSALIASALLWASCSSGPATEETKKAETGAPSAIAAAKTTDPVCGMEKDASWTDHVVNGTDTTWFCSAHCKDVYSAAPDKYKK